MATSNTVSTTTIRTQQIIDHAFRRCKLTPQQITSEMIETAKDLLFMFLSTLPSKGIALWALQKEILPLYEAQGQVEAPVGTVDVLNCNLRESERQTGTATASEGDADNAFDGDLDTACTQVAAAGWIQVQFDSAIRVPIFGIMPNATGTWSITLQGSNDGTTWTTFYTNTSLEAVEGEWFWFDIDGMAAWEYIRLNGVGSTVLDVKELYLGNRPREVPLPQINRDDFENLSDKLFLGRPTEYWYDKQRTQPILHLWPVPDSEYTFYQLVCRVQRYVEDVGRITQELEIPQRWHLAIVAKLAEEVGRESKEVDPQLIPVLERNAVKELQTAWDGESDSAPVYLRPRIGVYTK